MAQVAGIASFSTDGHRKLFCPYCGYCLKIELYPTFSTGKKKCTCKRCNSKLTVKMVEEDETNNDGSIKTSLSITSSVKTKQTLVVMKN